MLSALFQHPIQGIMPTTVGIGANTPTKWLLKTICMEQFLICRVFGCGGYSRLPQYFWKKNVIHHLL